jgi:hypothetical protein
MEEQQKGGKDYSSAEGLTLTLGYLEDPSNIECPSCGFDTIEVVGFVNADSLHSGAPEVTSPDREYAVILFCHGCRRGAALHLDYGAQPDREAA